MSSRHANKCGACDLAHAQVKGAKCALHDSSTSPTIDRALLGDRPGWPLPGWSGPVLKSLIGYNPRANVPRFTNEGQRVT